MRSMPQRNGFTKDSNVLTLHAALKIPGGKLLRTTCIVRGQNLELVKITGDFFLHPEDNLEKLEEELSGIEAEEGAVKRAVQAFFRREKPVIIGAEPEDFVTVILKALESG